MIKEFIQEGNIQKTLENVCLILHQNDSQVEQLEEEFISICDYIGSHMDSNHVMRWLDIIENTLIFVNNTSINIDDTLVLCSKMCMLCKQIYHIDSMNLQRLRSQVIIDLESPLKHEYIRSLANILPIPTSQSFPVACNISMCFVKYIEKANDLSLDSKELHNITNRLRLCIEYITRKNVFIENPHSRDSDCIWFLWNLLTQLSQSKEIQTVYRLFTINWKSNSKKKRMGLLWGSVYLLRLHKIEWTTSDTEVFTKIKNISRNLMLQVKQQNPKPVVKKSLVPEVDVNALWDTYEPKLKSK